MNEVKLNQPINQAIPDQKPADLLNKTLQTKQVKKTGPKRVVIVLVIGTILVLSAVAAIVVYRKRKTVPIQTPAIQSVNNQNYKLEQIEFVGEFPDFPKSLKVYNNIGLTPNTIRFSQKIASLYSLSPNQQINYYWTSPENSYFLTADPETYLITLSKEVRDPLKSSNIPFNQTAAIQKAKEYLEGIGLKNLQPIEEDVSYLSGQLELNPSSAELATVISIPFAFKIDNFDVYYQNQVLTQTKVFLDKDLNLLKIVTFPLEFEAELEQEKTTLSLKEVLENIKQRNFVVINVYQEIGRIRNVSNFKKASFQKVSLEYRFVENLNKFIPYYHLTGTAFETSQSSPTIIEIITPATD